MSQMLIPNTVTEACQMLSSGNRVACAGATNLYVDREKGKYLDRNNTKKILDQYFIR